MASLPSSSAAAAAACPAARASSPCISELEEPHDPSNKIDGPCSSKQPPLPLMPLQHVGIQFRSIVGFRNRHLLSAGADRRIQPLYYSHVNPVEVVSLAPRSASNSACARFALALTLACSSSKACMRVSVEAGCGPARRGKPLETHETQKPPGTGCEFQIHSEVLPSLM